MKAFYTTFKIKSIYLEGINKMFSLDYLKIVSKRTQRASKTQDSVASISGDYGDTSQKSRS